MVKRHFAAVVMCGVSLVASVLPAYAQPLGGASAAAALGGQPTNLQSKHAADVLLKSVSQVVRENPALADSVGDRALVEAVRHSAQTYPEMSQSIVSIASRLKPHLSQEIQMAAAGGSAFDGAMGAMEAEAPPAWATAAAPVSPAPQGAPFGAADEEVPAWATASVPVVANDGGEEDIFNLGLEDLMNTKVVTASKSKERAFDVAAAITVITNEDLRRSGYTNVMDALRMVPGMQVAQISTPSWSVGSRGFGDEYANKLLVMIDGRSIYTSTFSGVFWDEVNLPMEDIDRIEVIRGPGATIWGANAVNGVINIVTKESKYTQGAYLSGGAGNYEKMFGEGRSGGKFGDNGHYRFYGRHLERGRWDAADGSGEQRTGIERLMSGFRADWEGGGHSSYTVQGEVQKGSTEQHTRQFGISDETEITTAYLRGRWDKVLSDDSSISLSSYLDHDSRKAPSVFIKVTNFDLDFNHKKRWLDRNELIWGLGYRLTSDNYENTSLLSFTPAEDTRHLFSAFVQNKLEVTDSFDLIAGSKFEHNDYTGFEVQPTAKFSYRPSERSTLWGSVARAVRTPSRTEDTISFILLEQPTVPPTVIVGQGNPDIESEELIAYELGYRFSPQEGLVFDIAGYYNDYDNLVTLMPGTPFFNGSAVIVPTPVMNISDAEIYGVELSGSWQVTPSWKLAGYYTFSELTVNTPNIGPAFSAYQDLSLLNDYESLWPEQTFSIRSYYNVTDNVELDAALYYMPSLGTVTNLDGTPRNVDAYLRGDVRLGWRPWEGLEVSLAGLNLIEGEHAEFTDSRFNRATLIGRSYYGKVTWHF